MKKLMIFAALILTTATAAQAQQPTRNQQEESKRIVNYYARQNGFRTIKIGRAAFSLTSFVSRLAGERELRQAVSHLDNIHLIHLEEFRSANRRVEDVLLDTRIYCDRYGYDELLVSEEYGTCTEVYCRYGETGDISGVVIVNRSSGDDSRLNIAFLHGDLTARDLAGLLGEKMSRQANLAAL